MSEIYDLVFEIPSKTFIIGEYLAINGTASLVAATQPAFFIKTNKDKNFGFHPESPAGRLRNELKLTNVGFSIIDPHDGRGGFGKSTAEFLAVYLYDQYSRSDYENLTDGILDNLSEFVPHYQSCAGGDYRPSGADLVAQVSGGFCWYDGMNFNSEKLNWPFPGYDIFIFHTGKKMATHEHLKDLKTKNLQSLIPILLAARTSIDHENLRVFAESLNYYYDVLNESGLSDPNVYSSILELRRSEKVLAAKGCGAMGMDTVIVLAEKSAENEIKEMCYTHDFQFITSVLNSHSGAIVRRPS